MNRKKNIASKIHSDYAATSQAPWPPESSTLPQIRRSIRVKDKLRRKTTINKPEQRKMAHDNRRIERRKDVTQAPQRVSTLGVQLGRGKRSLRLEGVNKQ